MTVLDDEEWEEFVQRIKKYNQIPTPTPKIENVRKIIKNYVRDKYNYRRQDIYA